ncbi:MAG TPA: FAD-dependent oxidoreductase, partial [Candidatus Cloacimonadota bacterium]|nr:FAD-dependent oxidoreductase [Candidatus Cloacimonadota bacterium]
MKYLIRTFFVAVIIIPLSCANPKSPNNSNGNVQKFESDLCVYGGSGPGISAAVAAAREGYSVIIIEPAHKIGGLLGSGFRMQQDVPYADHLG